MRTYHSRRTPVSLKTRAKPPDDAQLMWRTALPVNSRSMSRRATVPISSHPASTATCGRSFLRRSDRRAAQGRCLVPVRPASRGLKPNPGLPAEARKRTFGGRRSQPRDLGDDLRRDHHLRDDNDRLGWGWRQGQNGGSPDGGPRVRILLPPAASQVRTIAVGTAITGRPRPDPDSPD